MGYRPNAAARSLRGGATNRVAVLLSPPQRRFASPIFLELLATLEQRLREADKTLTVVAANTRDEEPALVRALVEDRIADALVLGRTRVGDARVRYLLEQDFPFVTFGRTPWPEAHPWVDIDYRAAGRAAVAALVADDKLDGPKFVPIDGKTLRGSGGAKHRDNPLHMVSAWATRQGMTLGQVAVDSKSNEITAIPKLLEMLELKGAIVSIDAMGCQKEIAKQIVDGGGDYVLAVKDNHPKLLEAIQEFFLQRHENEDFQEYGTRGHHTTERARGQIESRYYHVAPVPESIRGLRRGWKGLGSIGQAITTTSRARWQRNQRGPILHQQPRTEGKRVRHFGPRTLGNRKHALGSGCRLQGRFQSASQRRKHAELWLPAKVRHQPAPARHFQREYERQTEKGCVEHRIPRKTPIRLAN